MIWLNDITNSGHEFEQTPGDSEGQGSLVCCSPWGHKELDTTERLNNNNSSVWLHWVLLVVHGISISAACKIFVSQPRIEHVSPAL